MKIRFIGGVADGEIIDVCPGQDHITVRDPDSSSSTLEIKIAHYKREQLATENQRYDVFLLSSLDSDDLILNLLRNYNPQKATQ